MLQKGSSGSPLVIMMVMYNNNDNNYDNNYNYIDINSWKYLQICWLNEKSTHLNIKWQAFATDTIILNFQLYSINIITRQ